MPPVRGTQTGPGTSHLTLAQAIIRAAHRYGLDPYAMMAIASHESGLRYGAVGDNGSSFGPFQLHWGGAMPAQYRGNRAASMGFADSLAGIMYVARQMAASGARGLRGRAAIAAMSRNFERPANPGAEISDAVSWYRQNRGRMPGGGAGQPLPTMPQAPTPGAPPGPGRNVQLLPMTPYSIQAPPVSYTPPREWIANLFGGQQKGTGVQPLGAPQPAQPQVTPSGYTTADLYQQLQDLRSRLLK